MCFRINDTINDSINDLINLNSTEALVLEVIKTNKRVNKKQIATIIERTEITVQRAIKKLLNEKLIKRVGSNKTGYWEIV